MEEKLQRVLVICSFSSRVQHFKAPKGYDLSKGRLVLKNYGDRLDGNGFHAMPYEVRVYVFE